MTSRFAGFACVCLIAIASGCSPQKASDSASTVAAPLFKVVAESAPDQSIAIRGNQFVPRKAFTAVFVAAEPSDSPRDINGDADPSRDRSGGGRASGGSEGDLVASVASEPRQLRLAVELDPARTDSSAQPTWTERRWTSAAAADPATEPDSVAHLSARPDGTIELSHTLEASENVVTWFEPPLVVVPALLSQGQPFTQSLRMVVRPRSNPNAIRAQGKATSRVELIGPVRISIRGKGPIPAHHIRSTLIADLGLPKVEVVTDSWFDSRGLLAERSRERVTTLGIVVRRIDTWWVRVDLD